MTNENKYNYVRSVTYVSIKCSTSASWECVHQSDGSSLTAINRSSNKPSKLD